VLEESLEHQEAKMEKLSIWVFIIVLVVLLQALND